MAKFIIRGEKRLEGKVKISGAKNAALPIMAATLLVKGKVRLLNVPDIADIWVMVKILRGLGAKIKKLGLGKLEIDTSGVTASQNPDYDLVRHMRASILLAGPLLGRFGRVSIAQPGGCVIGSRPIDTHLDAFQKLGAKVLERGSFYIIETRGGVKATKVVLAELSVTATENIMMATSLIRGTTEIRLAAAEPHVEEVAKFLNKCGAKISGGGTHNIFIEGVKELKGVEFEISPDPLEIATFAIAAAATRGDVVIENINPDHLDMFFNKFSEANVNFSIEKEKEKFNLHVMPSTVFKAINIRTDIYPGFPTDLQAPMAVLLTQAQGTSRIFETMYEGRLNYLKELIKMGANAVIQTPHQALITGPTPLVGKEITSFDLRAGATLIIAALIAKGESTIDQIELVDRGYEKIDEKLRRLGAEIKRVG